MPVKKYKPMEPCQRLAFRNQLKVARLQALSNAEDFDTVIHAIERLGSYLSNQYEDLRNYTNALEFVVRDLADADRNKFNRLYDLIVVARNDAVHQGAVARKLTIHAIELALLLEEALNQTLMTVADYMTRNPIVAEPWQSICYVRQQLLVNSFSCLPVKLGDKWYLVEDNAIAQYLREEKQHRKQRMLTPLGDFKKKLTPTEPIVETSDLAPALKLLEDSPLLVVTRESSSDIVGVIASFDLL